MKQPPELPTDGKMRKRIILWGIMVLIVGGILGLTHDIIITNYLAHQICIAEPNPKTFIKKTVDYPESIYWEDNIYPGFDEADRLLMIRNFLDGVHLKTMALNGLDGTIYLFKATEKDWQATLGIKKTDEQDWKDYFKTMEREAKAIADRGKIISRKEASQLNYKVVFNPVPLTQFQRRYLYSDEVIITENKTNEVIGFNRRLMRLWYFMFPDIALGNMYYSPKPMCGYGEIIRFDEKVINMHGRKLLPSKHLEFIENRLYFKEKTSWK